MTLGGWSQDFQFRERQIRLIVNNYEEAIRLSALKMGCPSLTTSTYGLLRGEQISAILS